MPTLRKTLEEIQAYGMPGRSGRRPGSGSGTIIQNKELNKHLSSYQEGWEKGYKPLIKAVKDLQNGVVKSYYHRAIIAYAKQAQQDIGKGRNTVTLYRTEFPGVKHSLGGGAFTSYSQSKEGADTAAYNLADAYNLDTSKYKIRSVNIPVSNILFHSGQFSSGNDRDDAEKEVIVSNKPIKKLVKV